MRILFLYLLFLFAVFPAKAQTIKPFGAAIYVDDLERASEWYQDIFDVTSTNKISYPELNNLNIEILNNEYLQFELVERDNSFSIYELEPDYNIREKPLRGFYKLAFQVEDIEYLYEQIQAKQVEIHFELTTDSEFGIKTFIIRDPGNNLLQFIEIISK
ncbi:VOC family protein [Robertkochia solimangrovi]|uniref:VOC family protein n=1 Tax=Robertkochia solimangrovi TaxID=2213046 RepID=UPI0013A54DB7|nr:VOC family protein [Robertkochia solimangrovi]